MRSNLHNEALPGKGDAQSHGNSSPLVNPRIEDIDVKYPQVPPLYRSAWQMSDEELPYDENWQETLGKALAAVEAAKKTLSQLQHTEGAPMSPARLKSLQQSLLFANHQLDDIITATTRQYPLPQRTFFDIASGNPKLEPYLPKVIVDHPERLVIWIPALPPARRTVDNHLFKEFEGLVQSLGDRPHFQQWHGDFIHVFHPTSLRGIRDVDNYNYKPIIDALALALGLRDCTDQFSSAQYNLISEKIQPGCYLHVSKRCEKVPFFQFFEDLILASM